MQFTLKSKFSAKNRYKMSIKLIPANFFCKIILLIYITLSLIKVKCDRPVVGRYVAIYKKSTKNKGPISIKELEVFGFQSKKPEALIDIKRIDENCDFFQPKNLNFANIIQRYSNRLNEKDLKKIAKWPNVNSCVDIKTIHGVGWIVFEYEKIYKFDSIRLLLDQNRGK